VMLIKRGKASQRSTRRSSHIAEKSAETEIALTSIMALKVVI